MCVGEAKSDPGWYRRKVETMSPEQLANEIDWLRRKLARLEQEGAHRVGAGAVYWDSVLEKSRVKLRLCEQAGGGVR